MKLGDLETLKNKSITVGSVFIMPMDNNDGITPKGGQPFRNKMFVIVGIEDEKISVASVIINSGINASAFNKKAPYQHEIYGKNYDFLSKDKSYVDAYKIHIFEIERIKNKADFLGTLDNEDISCVLNKLQESPVNQPKVLKVFHIKQ